ncbi:MAG: F0F1 ATP synthase subunit B [Patescibacteria group bacterium]|nr:F0F1 ATP synthase subunit B [Patescibacteria group bacterium]
MEKLGIQPVMLLMQLINFVILVAVLTKFLYKPVLKLIDERRKKIEEGLALAEKMKVKEEELRKEREAVLDKAKDEGQKIIEEYKERGRKVEADIVKSANEEAKGIKEKTAIELEQEREKIWQDLEKQMLGVASAMAKTVVADILTDKNQLLLIDKKLEKLEKENQGGSKAKR